MIIDLIVCRYSVKHEIVTNKIKQLNKLNNVNGMPHIASLCLPTFPKSVLANQKGLCEFEPFWHATYC